MSRKTKAKPKTSEKQFRFTLQSAGVEPAEIDRLTLIAQQNGTVTTGSRGKLEALKTRFPEFLEICLMLERFEEENKTEIDELMIENDFPPVAKMSVNVAK